VLAVDLAAGRLLELLREARVGVGRPLDQVQPALALPDLRLQRRRRAARADSRRGHAQRRRKRGAEDVHPANPPHPSPPSPPGSISNVCSGRHSRRTRLPFDSTASCEEVSRFCLTTLSSPPESSSTT